MSALWVIILQPSLWSLTAYVFQRLSDVRQAIEVAKEQADDDLWEDLLKYSESRPAFIRGLLENVGPEINPIRLIRRIKNGLEIPGLKEALMQDFQLQISLLDGSLPDAFERRQLGLVQDVG
ncbi:hypothetical protein BDZ89DRAFT_1132404 [Hymenopellis radicata]|nr:hypothetical protein BDZ89DRAFT_1132404 [Hymenopellis radicata]